MTEHLDKERTLANKQVCTLERKDGRWHVGMWNPDNTNHWYQSFDSYEQALAEYNRYD